MSRTNARGRMPLWLSLALSAGVLAWCVGRLEGGPTGGSFTRVDTRRLRLEAGSEWFDARWEGMLAGRVAAFGDVSTLDRPALRALAEEVADLPFVSEVGVPEVVWPDGLELPVRLRRPVACIVRGTDYFAVAPDGTVLPGAWLGPPAVNPEYGQLEDAPSGGFLPVIGPIDGCFDDVLPGDYLADPAHLDALDTAISMERYLPPSDRELLGPLVIDATRARIASVEETGIRFLLEERRLVVFGRAPWSGAPGELPAPRKWEALAAGLEKLRRGEDWDLADVRWDVPKFRERGAAQQP